MPFIQDPITRKVLDIIIDNYKEYLIPNGNLNYFLYALCKRTISPSYNNYKNYMAELTECARFIGHDLLDPYEEIKRQENGGIK